MAEERYLLRQINVKFHYRRYQKILRASRKEEEVHIQKFRNKNGMAS